jgi:hypothetical protein
MRRRILSILLLITSTIFIVTGCSSKSNHTDEYYDKSADLIADSTTSVEGDASAGRKDTVDSVDTDDLVDSVYPTNTVDFVDPVDDYDRTAGLLTAGEWNDNSNWMFFTNLIADRQLSTPIFEMNPINRIMVTVLSEEGSPVKNARVELLNNAEEVIWEAASNNNGIAYVFFNLLNDNQVPESLSISKNGISTSADIILAEGFDEQNTNNQSNNQIYQDVTVSIDDISNTKALDLMFVFDTTGSMGDELSYLQTEFEDISKKVADQNTRYSVNFYRDEGDQYVVKSNEFTYDTDLVLKQLNREVADGGGDYPEAVDQALYDGIFNHNWNDERRV